MQRFLQHKSSLEPRNNPQGENGFAKEFQELKNISSRQKRDKAFSTNHGEKEYNRTKNRYKDILPYDYSRIVLPEIKGVDGSDYINGNYIKGPTKNIMYLAAQGPLPKTVDDFWRMMISHNIQVVVMACREYELGKLKCKRYWPESMEETLTFAGMKISLESEEAMGDGFTVRTLAVQAGKTKHNVTQFHYTAWPDHDVPRSATPLIELTRSFRTFVGSQDTPVLVHCSAGCGRTGTICALDYARTLLQTGRTEELSVFDIVANLRRQRVAMVQTKEQYTLVYKAVEELVNEELRKQNHLYVNVSVGDQQGGEEQNYENSTSSASSEDQDLPPPVPAKTAGAFLVAGTTVTTQ
ncbi:predicted protein [Nematostella vectensis]|uniref:protein-tyrosine-phosphatase n=1 Tax=Nematostella vectensis TaxID=45351 RepID=A7RJD7_NEMVE|nr:predicted protein [Nematostella vectensis]|eukprot:XP_001640421.1 predicted protein [Nematostella vectensis]